ncbi:hypothetical protein B0H21DRAFT_752596 [Amylocystis lapponica]|nr:hypothetical protein B0H21DRAFT_752596 [Amylocystis lapponica]
MWPCCPSHRLRASNEALWPPTRKRSGPWFDLNSAARFSTNHTGEADSSPPPPYQDAPLPMFDGTDIFYEELDTSTDSTLTRIAERELGYAILSHRWLSEGEPTFQDMLQFSHAGAGFYKLVKFCMTGLAHGLNWAWADTCCIDKTKSSELDEAIRSMYRWYRDAKVCIVYLADTLYRTDMPRDAWFTRGWTLQELLAPARIKFYNRRWEPLAAQVNDRWDLDFLKTLSEITDIPVANLQAFAPGTRHVSRIMTWASKRETTRVEDVAYSLIGLFDVSLMPAYGEGEKAFYRLQLAIMERSRSFKLLMWDGEASREHSMIAGSPDCFTNTPPVYRHPPVWVRDVGNRYGHKWSILDLDTMIARGGTFAMTNAGLRIDLVIYDLCMDITTEESSFHFPLLSEEPGEFVANHRVRWKLQDGEGVAEFDFAGPLGVANRPRIWRFSIGVMDFEWNDAHYKSESLERILACDPLGTSDADTPSNGAEAVEIRGILELIRNRRDRAYIVVFLEERGDVGGSRCFRMIKHGPRIHRIRRPWDGWRRSETVYIMGN